MDEPFGALDPVSRDALQSEFKTLQKTLGLTVVMVTHDMTEALIMADRSDA
jgi:osmoprotectant transport system ATP-binding protein